MKIECAENLSDVSFVRHGFFGKSGGVGKPPYDTLNASLKVGDEPASVLENRSRIAAAFGLQLGNVAIPYQIHSDVVVCLDKCPEWSVECDAFITNSPGLLIGVTTADCAPILVCDTEKRYIAAIHCGWRGATVGIIERTLEKLASFGCADIVCAIGPCIHQKSFRVGEEVIGQVPSTYISSDGKFDLLEYVSDKLFSCGAKSVSKINVDTFQNEEYFSYRRQNGAQNGYGAQFSGIVIMEERQ
jgi:YfiH family protein